MSSENKAPGSRQEVRRAVRERPPRQPTANSSSAPAERPSRPRDNGERRDRPPQREAGARQERQPRREGDGQGERPRRPQSGSTTVTEKSKPATEDKTHGPVVHVKGDIASGSTWAKGSSGPSFADMVRQRANAAAESRAAKVTPPPQREEEAEPKRQPTPPPPPPPHPPAQPEPSQTPEELEEEEEEVVVINTVQAPAVVELEPIPEPLAPVQPMMAPHYVLEIERVASVNLPPRVAQVSEAQRGLFVFSAQAGKPPTPPSSAQQHAQYRPDAANLGVRPWSMGIDSRLQQAQQQQQAWPSTGPIDYWSSTSERAPAARQFMGTQAQSPYNSYPSAAPPAHQRTPGNTFPMRFRPDVPEAALRQQPSIPFTRAPQTTNGGGVW